jgi:hypothetical protein
MPLHAHAHAHTPLPYSTPFSLPHFLPHYGTAAVQHHKQHSGNIGNGTLRKEQGRHLHNPALLPRLVKFGTRGHHRPGGQGAGITQMLTLLAVATEVYSSDRAGGVCTIPARVPVVLIAIAIAIGRALVTVYCIHVYHSLDRRTSRMSPPSADLC